MAWPGNAISARRAGGSRRRALRSRRTSRSWRSPATARRRRRDGQLSRRRRRPRPSTRRGAIGAPLAANAGAKAAATSSAASPIATTARMRSGVAVIGVRSRPLFRPPAMSTTWSKARIATEAACGVVALESSYQATPSASPTSSMRCGGPRNPASAVATASAPASPVSMTSADAARRVGDVVGQRARHRPHLGDRAARPGEHRRRRRAGHVVVGAARAERHVASRRAAQVLHHHGVVDPADRHVVAALVGEQAGLGVGVGREVAVPVEVVGREVEPRRGIGPEGAGERQAEAGALDDEARRGRGRSPRRAGPRVLPAATVRDPAARSIAAVSSVVVVLPSVPVTASIGRGPPGRYCSHS